MSDCTISADKKTFCLEEKNTEVCTTSEQNTNVCTSANRETFSTKKADGKNCIDPGGEKNTASNVGVGGVGVFKQKVNSNLEFKNINAGSSKVTVTDDTLNNEIDVDVVLADQPQAEARTSNTTLMSPLRTGQAITQALLDGPIPITTSDISNAYGNYILVDDISKLAPPSGGEHLLAAGVTHEFVDNNITGLPPLFFNALRIQDEQNIILQAPLILNALIYVGTGAFIRADAVAIYVQNNIVYVTPFGVLWDMTSSKTLPSSTFFLENMGYFGLSLGSLKGASQLSFTVPNILDWTTGLNLTDIGIATITEPSALGSPSASGPFIKAEGERVSQFVIRSGLPTVFSGQSFLELSPSIPGESIIIIKDASFKKSTGGDFFLVGIQGIIISAADNSTTGSILSLADNGSGGTTVTATAALPASIVDTRKLTISATTNYNGTFAIFNVTATTFDIAVAFVGDDATGSWDFNSVTFTTGAAHTLSDGLAVQIEKSFLEYNKGRVIFDASASVFSMDNIIFQSPGGALTGEWTTSLKQDDTRMTVSGNGDQQDTATIVVGDISTPETLVIPGNNTPVDIVSWDFVQDRQYTGNAPGEDTGSFRFDGDPIISNLFFEITGEMVTGSGASIAFSLFKKPEGGSYSIVGTRKITNFTNKLLTITLIFFDVEQSKSEVFKLTGERIDSSGNILIDIASFSPQKIAEGF